MPKMPSGLTDPNIITQNKEEIIENIKGKFT